MRRIKRSELDGVRSQLLASQGGKCAITGAKLPAKPPGHVDHCFTEATYLLTPGGWVSSKDVKGLPVAAVGPSGGFWFETPSRFISRKCTDGLVYLEKPGYKSLTTRGHLIPLGRELVEAEDVPKMHNRRDKFIQDNPVFSGEGDCSLTDSEIRFAVAFQADAHHSPGGWVRFRLRRTDKVARLQYLLRELGIYHTVHKTDCFQVYIPKASVPSYCDKDFSVGPSLDLEQCRVALYECGRWDGHAYHDRLQFSSTDHSAWLNWMAVWAKLGLSPTLSQRRATAAHKTLWISNIPFKTRRVSVRDIRHEYLDFDSQVYCVTVSSGRVLTMHEGCIQVSGNCHETGEIRGVLKPGVNGAEGKMRRVWERWTGQALGDFPAFLRALADYLENPPGKGSGLIYHTHKTEAEKREARLKRQRKQAAQRRASK